MCPRSGGQARFGRSRDRGIEIERCELQIHLAELESRHFEQVVDEAREVRSLAVDQVAGADKAFRREARLLHDVHGIA
jgi:hypothetical protein